MQLTIIYKDWLDSTITGGHTIVDIKVGAKFTAWEGYISGQKLSYSKTNES